jgi:hypothetical protein
MTKCIMFVSDLRKLGGFLEFYQAILLIIKTTANLDYDWFDWFLVF